jgi:hypothetical protein
VLHAAAFVGHAVGRSNGRCIEMHPDRQPARPLRAADT